MGAMNKCPHCQSNHQQIKAGHNQSGSQRYVCKNCGKTYTPSPKLRGYSSNVRQQAIQLYHEGHSFRAVSRQLGIGTQSVINWVRENEHSTQLANSNAHKSNLPTMPTAHKENKNG